MGIILLFLYFATNMGGPCVQCHSTNENRSAVSRLRFFLALVLILGYSSVNSEYIRIDIASIISAAASGRLEVNVEAFDFSVISMLPTIPNFSNHREG